MAENLFGNATPALGNAADGSTNYALGTRFTASVAGSVTHGRWRFPSTIPSTTVQVQVGVYRVSDQVLLGSTSFPLGATLGAWNEVAFPSPIPLASGVTYAVVVWTPLRYVATTNYPWPAASTSLTAGAANGWLATNPGGVVFPTTQSGNAASYFADVVFELAAGGGSVAPSGLAVPVAVGSPSAVAAVGVAPAGLQVPAAAGDPLLVWSGSAAPDGALVPVDLGVPVVGASPVAPDGLVVPVAVGAASAAWSASVGPDGLPVPVVVGAAGVSVPGAVVARPFAGVVARPSLGVVVRPDAGVVSRP